MRRRDFIRSVSYAVFVYPLAAWAQRTTPVVGFLNGSSATAYAAYDQAFIRGLAETGFKVGENVSIEYRWAEGRYDQIPAMADDLVRRQVAVIAASHPQRGLRSGRLARSLLFSLPEKTRSLLALSQA